MNSAEFFCLFAYFIFPECLYHLGGVCVCVCVCVFSLNSFWEMPFFYSRVCERLSVRISYHLLANWAVKISSPVNLSKILLVSCGLVPNYHKLGGLKQQQLILSKFWGSSVWNQGISRAALPLKTLKNSSSTKSML